MDKEHIRRQHGRHWHHEGADLEDPWNEPKDDLHMITAKRPEERLRTSQKVYFTIEFEQGTAGIDRSDRSIPLLSFVTKLKLKLGAENGVGIDDLVETPLVGVKSRGVYENPADASLYTALSGPKR